MPTKAELIDKVKQLEEELKDLQIENAQLERKLASGVNLSHARFNALQQKETSYGPLCAAYKNLELEQKESLNIIKEQSKAVVQLVEVIYKNHGRTR